MLVSEEIIDKLYQLSGNKRYMKAIRYVNQDRVNIVKDVYENEENFELQARVLGSNENYKTYVKITDGNIDEAKCNCLDYESHDNVCKHILATVMEFDRNPIYEQRNEKIIKFDDYKQENYEPKEVRKDKYRSFKQIINTFYEQEIQYSQDDTYNTNYINRKVKIVPKLIYDKYYKEMKVEFKIGESQLYKLKNLNEFYERMLRKEKYKYGAKLEFIHDEGSFVEECLPILNYILKYAEIIKYVNSNGNSNYRYYGKALNENYIILGNSGIDELFEILEGQTIDIKIDSLEYKVNFVSKSPNIKFRLEQVNKEEYMLVTDEDAYKYSLLEGKKYIYILTEDTFYRCSKEFKNTALKLLDIFKKNFTKEIIINKKQLPEFFSLVMPKVKDYIEINEQSEELKKYIPQNLGVKVFMDFDDSNYITANVKFCYGDFEFNPLDENEKVDIPRNFVKENECINMFRRTGFMLDIHNNRLILVNDDKIYNFLLNDIEEYMQKFEVMVTDNFKTKEIKQPKIGNIGIRVENNLLNIDLSKLDFDKDEIEEILAKYNIKKRYHRLKDGSFLSLEENSDIEFLNNLEQGMGIDYTQLKKGNIKVPAYRSLYLNKLLQNMKNVEITKDKNYKDLVNGITNTEFDETIKIPSKMNTILRYYQKTGYKWLKILDKYNMGGILADDMGLGKTIQVLSVLQSYIQNTKKEDRKPSIVIAPSSLVLNWKNESERFAEDINVLIINGQSEERVRKINNIPQYDLIITSYDLLKRDIESYQKNEYIFKYSIADEAQYVKNSNTQNAKALKAINAETRFALTGTPIENSLAELWSIFDYIMPGYLFSYNKFKKLYEIPIIRENDEEAMKKLKMLIEPFVLRRIKKDVLKELPEKTITILNNEMGNEQEKIYLSYLAQAKTEAMAEINTNGFEKSQIKILSLLTRLRQICCHPSLFIENYNSESSKLNQCIEIVKDGIEAGHKILLFSGYTSMFDIIEKELRKEKIQFYKLTGKTKVDERVDLVDDFNKNDNIKVFLISLKAGGTGLNLTGADMVIHYDPWWNISAENQATDRAYRIGQKNNVQVYKLITKNSIEEKIYELQEKKAKLIDNMLSTKTTFINTLSKEEIIGLFE